MHRPNSHPNASLLFSLGQHPRVRFKKTAKRTIEARTKNKKRSKRTDKSKFLENIPTRMDKSVWLGHKGRDIYIGV
ncbi:MAG: hypothetical protein DI551_03630 [Micavibrio aeruginosavorus]|uniref:Uncharacterized protein n=1 Tax=Micavibrio aeruginosavorus TaxID=349221 RepID=A0A2W5Q767_9BACT|nr:MAG: hypothetical protein DI551_03630 [Micavibrio aeruginosavorus]